jgi:hypothetical protein
MTETNGTEVIEHDGRRYRVLAETTRDSLEESGYENTLREWRKHRIVRQVSCEPISGRGTNIHLFQEWENGSRRHLMSVKRGA